MMSLSRTLQNKIIDFLVSLSVLDGSEGQQAFIYHVGVDQQLHIQIQFGKSRAQFVPLLVSSLTEYGKLEDGRDAIEAVLETAKTYVGQEHQTHCDVLLKELREYYIRVGVKPLHVFISYCKEDQEWYEKIRRVLKNDKRLSSWDKSLILLGQNKVETVNNNLKQPRIMIILISNEYLKSNDTIIKLELDYAKTAHESELIIFWIPVNNLQDLSSPFEHLKPVIDTPLVNLTGEEQQTAINNVHQGILSHFELRERGFDNNDDDALERRIQGITGQEIKKDEPELIVDTSQGIFKSLEDLSHTEILPSRSPIVVALEGQDNPLTEKDILSTERHVTVQLSIKQLESLSKINTQLSGNGLSFKDIFSKGVEVWNILQDSQPRLQALFDGIQNSKNPQPVAWMGKADLLLRISMVATM
ncbi:MAG: TIR domain-containing protein [bacterium]|nr:TIR domain-containing protein [bacterium]